MNFLLNHWLTILGILLTLLFGLQGILLYRKYFPKLSLSYYEHDCISLVHSLMGKIKGLEINYNSRSVSPNLIYLSGSLFNDGNRDIEEKLLIKPLKAILPDKYRWITFDITDKSGNLDCDINIKNNEVEIEWELFKSAEFFRFHSLVERTADNDLNGINGFLHKCADDLSRDLKFYHRITNMKDILKEDILRFRRKDGRRYDWERLLIFPFLAVILFVMFMSNPFENSYLIVNEDNVEYEVIFNKSIIVNKKGEIEAGTIAEKDIRSLIQPNLEFKKIDTKPFSSDELKQMIIFPIAILLQGLIELLKMGFHRYRQNKIKILLNL